MNRSWTGRILLVAALGSLVVALFPSLGTCEARSQPAAAIYNEGNRYFRDALYAQARDRYEAALALGARDARLEYNLACTLARAGDIAGARLHLERAVLLAPGDEDAVHNLSLLIRQIDGEEHSLGSGPLDRLNRPGWGLLPSQLAMWALGAWTSALLLWALLPWVRAPGIRSGLRVASGVFWCVLAGLLAIFYACRLDRSRPWAILVSGPVQVRAGPGEGERSVGTLAAGRRVLERRAQGAWSELQVTGEFEGWVPREVLEAIAQ